MLKLHHNPASPYARKVVVLAHETGQAQDVEIMPIKVWEEGDRLRADNPLAKIPTLILEDGSALYDSGVICRYLDSRHNGAKMFPGGDGQWAVERLHALATGATDAALALRADAMRGRDGEPDFYAARMRDTVEHALAALEKMLPEYGQTANAGTVAAACLIGYLDFRFADLDWRSRHPALAEWYAAFSARPSMAQTPPA